MPYVLEGDEVVTEAEEAVGLKSGTGPEMNEAVSGIPKSRGAKSITTSSPLAYT